MADFPTIIDLSPVPQRNQNIDDFSARADAFLGKLPTFGTQLEQWGATADERAATIDAAKEATETARDAAISARDAAQLAGNIYPDTATGLASGDQYFSVISSESNQLFTLYENDGGTAVAINTYQGGPLSDQLVTTSTGTQTVAGALDRRAVQFVSLRAPESGTFDAENYLETSTKVTAGMLCEAPSYRAPNYALVEPFDGGGNKYELFPGETGTDDGGSWINLSGSGLQAKGMFNEGVSVKQFGAPSDGSFDAQPNIQAAINYIESLDGLRGRELLIPYGDYRLDSTLKIIGAAVKLKGETASTAYGAIGDKVTSRLFWGGVTGGALTFLLDIGDTSQGGAVTRRVQLENIGFDGSEIVSGVGSVWAPEMILQGCSFSNVITAHDCYDSGGFGRNYSNTWRDCYFHNFSQFALRLRADCHRSNILQCHFTSVSTIVPISCIRVGDVDPSSLINIQGCNFEPWGDDGTGTIHWIDIRQGRAPTIVGNYFEVPAGSSIRSCIRFGAAGAVEGGMTASNRMVIRNSAPDYTSGKNAMQVANTIGHIVTGNHFEGYNNYSVIVTSTTDCHSNQYIGNKDLSVSSSTNEPGIFNVLLDSSVSARRGVADVAFSDLSNNLPVRLKNSAQEYVELLPGAADGTANASFRPGSDNLQSLGRSVSRWSDIYAGNGTINTSDYREKTQQRGADTAEKRVAIALKSAGQFFKWIAAVNKKGSDARWHYGWMAQEVIELFSAEGLDAHEYGMLCYDVWEEDEEAGIEAGDRYGLRMDQLIAFIVCNT